jgi:hypothetical protein
MLLVKRAYFQGEAVQLQDFLNLYYQSQEIKEVPIIEEGMDVVLRVKEAKHEEMFEDWALSFGLRCTIIETAK